MTLAAHQRALRDLIRGRAPAPTQDEAYFHSVATSAGLDVVREIVFWWRLVGVERACPLTAAALKRSGRFESVCAQMVQHHPISPYIDEQARVFLAIACADGQALVASVAAFEQALHAVQEGATTTYVMTWLMDPVAVLTGLLKGTPIDADQSSGVYRVVVSRSLPGLFVIMAMENESCSEEGNARSQDPVPPASNDSV